MRRVDDRGAALVLVLGVVLAVSVVALTVVSTTVHAAATSSATRAGVQAQAAAEQAIDDTLAQLSVAAVKGQEHTFPCQLPLSLGTAAGVVHVVTQIGYEVAGGPGAYACPLTPGSEVIGARLTARASTEVSSASGSRTVERVVQEVLTVNPAGPSDPLFGHGVFSDGNLTTTNNFEVLAGGAHTNGSYACSENGRVDGPLTVVGTVQLSNVCRVDGDLWAGGSVKGPGLKAPAAGTPNFGGTIVSATGDILLQGTARAAGDARAGGVIARNDGGDISAVIPGLVLPDSPSAPPAVVDMPPIYWSDLTPPGLTVQAFTAWVQDNAVANDAPTWSQAYQGTTCTAAKAEYSVNGSLASPAVPTVLDARTCDVVLQGNSAADPIELELHEDLTIVTKKFTSTNGLRVTSSKPGPDRAKLRIIVPLPEGASSCSGPTPLNIVFQAGGVDLAPDVEVFLYTNGTVQMTNGVDMHGSVYACATNFSVNTTITYADMTPPGMEPPPSPLYVFERSARYDLVP